MSRHPAYITITDTMIEELKLTPAHIMTYALIYGFSQDGESVYHGNQEYLRWWIRNNNGEPICRQQMITILNNLVDADLIEAIKREGKTTMYRVKLDLSRKIDPSRKLDTYPATKLDTTRQENLTGHIDKSILDNKEIIKGDNAHTQEINFTDFFKVFDAWWDMYDKKEWGGDANDVKHMIASLTLAEREQLIKYTSAYVKVTTKDKRKQPRYFFKDQMWRNDISTILPNATTLNYLADPMTEWSKGNSVAMVMTEQGIRYLTIADANAAGMNYKEMKPQN